MFPGGFGRPVGGFFPGLTRAAAEAGIIHGEPGAPEGVKGSQPVADDRYVAGVAGENKKRSAVFQTLGGRNIPGPEGEAVRSFEAELLIGDPENFRAAVVLVVRVKDQFVDRKTAEEEQRGQ